MNDDQRQAATLKVGISNYVATAALAVLAGGLGLFTYISQSFNPPASFYVLMGLTAAVLVSSIFLGGHGADDTVSKVAQDTWRNEPIWQFNLQAMLTLMALVLLISATAVGATSPKESNSTERRFERIERHVTRLSDRVLRLQSEQKRVQRRIRRMQRSTR